MSQLLSVSNPQYENILLSIQNKMKYIFGNSYDDDLYHFIRKLLLKEDNTKENVENELAEVFGKDSLNVQNFLNWLWKFLGWKQKSQNKTINNQENANWSNKMEIEESKEISTKQDKNNDDFKPFQKNIRPFQKPFPSNNNEINKNFKNNHINNEETQHSSEQNKDKKKILERIKKAKKISPPKVVPKEKNNILRPAIKKTDIVLTKKQKLETMPHQNQNILHAPETHMILEKQNNDQEENEHQDLPSGSVPPNSIKKRCRDWPSCKNEKCIYHHPTEQCQKFPKCSFGNQCFYIHPLCKFGIYCQRQDCAYMHPKMPVFQASFQGAPRMPTFKKENKTGPFPPKKNITLNTTNEITMKSNEEEAQNNQEENQEKN